MNDEIYEEFGGKSIALSAPMDKRSIGPEIQK